MTLILGMVLGAVALVVGLGIRWFLRRRREMLES